MDVVNKELDQLEELLLHSVRLLGNFLRRLTQSVLILEIIICGNDYYLLWSSLCKPVAESNSRYLRDILLIWRRELCHQDSLNYI